MAEIVPGQPVSDVDTYRLAVRAGFSPEQAVTATAVSIAENGSRLPEAVSPPNKNGTVDLGLWQINSIHWPSFGGGDRLTHAFNNASAAYQIWKDRQAATGNGWTAWSTFNQGQYKAFLGRAQLAQAQYQGGGGDISTFITDIPTQTGIGGIQLGGGVTDAKPKWNPATGQYDIPGVTTTTPTTTTLNPLAGLAAAIGGGFSTVGTSIHDAANAAVLSILHSLLALLFLALILLGLYLLLAN